MSADATTRYVLDPAAGLTQVLSDGTNTYLYGNGRLAQYQADMQYFGADGLGSVRQLYDATGQVLANNRYDPFGNVMSQYGDATSVFGFTGEQLDTATGLEYLRARYYSSAQGRFTTRDVWEGDPAFPMSYNGWSYANANPINHRDPSGRCDPDECAFQQDSGAWYTQNTGVEVVSAASWKANPNPDYDMDVVSYADCSLGTTCTLGGTASAHYWSLPSRDEAFDLWYYSDCDIWRTLGKAADWIPAVRAILMNYYDQGGRYGNIAYRSELKRSEALRKGTWLGVAATTGGRLERPFPPVGEGLLYRGGGRTIDNFTPRAEIGETEVSFRTSLSNKWPPDPPPAKPVFRPENSFQVVDTSLLPKEVQIIHDYPGHANVIGSPSQLLNAVIYSGRFPKNFPIGWLAASPPPPAGGN